MLRYIAGNLRIHGVKIHYYRTGGSKPPFVLLHGASDSGLCWTPVAQLLSSQYDVVMPDAQGHGFSERLEPGFTYINHAVQIAGLIQELRLEKPFIMGHSMGAGTAVNLAVKYPDLPRAIILEDPAWEEPEPATPENIEKKTKQREAFANTITGFGEMTRDELIAECRKTNPTWSEAEIGSWADAKLQFDRRLFSTMQFERPTYVELVPQIRCPSLLITSDGGIVKPGIARHAVQLSQSVRPLQWVQITDAGHNIRREQFRAFYEAVQSFLKTF